MRATMLGLFVPIIVLSGRGVYLYVRMLIVPGLREPGFRWQEHLIGLAGAFALLSHFLENVWYGVGRWFGVDWMLKGGVPVVLLMKLLICAGCVCVIAATSFRTHKHPLRDAILKLAAWWAFGVVMAYQFAI